MSGFIGNIGPWEMGFILIIVFMIIGPGKLPKVAEAIGAAIRNFKRASLDNAEDKITIEDKELK